MTEAHPRTAPEDRTERRFVNGRIHTGDPLHPYATGFTTRGPLVVSLDHDREVPADAVDLEGRVVLPGFVDGHVHVLAGGAALLGTDLSTAASVDDVLAAVRDGVRALPPGGWFDAVGLPTVLLRGTAGLTARELDAVSEGRLVCLTDADRHSCLVNTAVIDRVGLTGASADPTDGVIGRRADGTPTGVLIDRAMGFLDEHRPRQSREDLLAALLEGQRHLHSLGVTGWQDAIVGGGHGFEDSLPVYLEAASTGALTGRASAALWWDAGKGLGQIERFEHIRRTTVGRFSAPAVKMMLDGVPESGTAAMLEPYSSPEGVAFAHPARLYIPPEELTLAVVELDARGFDVHFHALGDRSVRDALDAVEAARQRNGHRGTRHQIAHVSFVQPADAARFRRLDVAMNLQMLWTGLDGLSEEDVRSVYGPDVLPSFSRLKEWDDLGVRWSAGSDWPVTDADPLLAMRVVGRRALRPGPALSDQALSFRTALAAYTSGAAYSSRLDLSGTLRVGGAADFVTLDADPFAPGALEHAAVEATFAGAEQVFSRRPGVA